MTTTHPTLGESFAWDGKRLVATSPEVVARLRRKALSASTSKSMQSCVARWAGERLLRTEEDPFAPAPLGTAAHAVLEDFYELLPTMRTEFARERILAHLALKQWPDDRAASDELREAVAANRARWTDEVRTAFIGLFKFEDPFTVRIAARELKIEDIEVAGVPTIGFIDRVQEVTVDGTTGYSADDYKSGTKLPNLRYGDDHGDQLRIYAQAIHNMSGEMPVAATVLYTKVGEKRDVDLRPRAMAKTLKTFEDSWVKHNRYMDEGAFPVKPSPLCGWCPLVNSCPTAKAEGHEAKAEGLPTAVALGIPVLRPGLSEPEPAADEDFSFMPDETVAKVEEIPVETGAETVSEVDEAAHMDTSGKYPTHDSEEDETPMDIIEEKPWVFMLSNGQVNPAAYAATAGFGLTSLSLETLVKGGVTKPKRTQIKALALTFRHIVAEAQRSWTGSASMQEGANTRLRGALRSVLDLVPPPFGGDDAAWSEWTQNAIRRCQNLTEISLEVIEEPMPASPWAGLEGIELPAVAAPVAVEKPVAVVEKVEQAPVKSPPAPRRARVAAAPAPEPAPAPDEDVDEGPSDESFPDDNFADFAA